VRCHRDEADLAPGALLGECESRRWHARPAHEPIFKSINTKVERLAREQKKSTASFHPADVTWCPAPRQQARRDPLVDDVVPATI